MKYKHLTLLTFLLSQNVSVYAMEPENQEKVSKPRLTTDELNRQLRELNAKNQNSASQAQQLKEDLLEAERKIEKFPVELLSGQKVFLIGTSGAGKSTLLNLLAKDNLTVDENGRLDTLDPVKGSEIGHDKNYSKTSTPQANHLQLLLQRS